MAYTINLTDGTIFATVADGTINTSSSMTLVGKNYAGYGEFLDENFIHMLENSSNSTSPPAPLTGQLWWDKTNYLLKVYNGTTFKTISAATASATAPTSNVVGDIWYDTTNQQLKVYTGTQFILVGPTYTSGTGVTGAIPDTILDNLAVSHVVVKLYVEDDVVGIISKDAVFTPAANISGFSNVRPGIQLATTIGANVPLFQGSATSAQLLAGYAYSDFILKNVNQTTSGTFGILNNTGLRVGTSSDFAVSVISGEVSLQNQTLNGNIYFKVNDGGATATVMQFVSTNSIVGVNGLYSLAANGQANIGSSSTYFNTVFAKSTSAQYADVAERFAADEYMEPGTVVELGGNAEITKAKNPLTDTVFGVISTHPAHLMNSGAGNNDTHPPIAMTGRVPVKVVGSVKKGDRLVSAGDGLARSALPGEATSFNVIGRSLVDKLDTNKGTIEAIVTIN